MTNKVYFPLLDIENVTPILERIAIFGGLDEKQLYQLFRSLLQVEYKAGEEIFNHTSDPQTEQLSVGNTHVFAISFYNSGYDPDGETHVAIKIGKTVVIGLVPAPSCPSP